MRASPASTGFVCRTRQGARRLQPWPPTAANQTCALEPASADALVRALPLRFESDRAALAGWLFAAGPASRHEIWRYLVLGTLAGLCMEVWLTRRMVKNSGMADLRAARGDAPSTEEPNRRWSHSP